MEEILDIIKSYLSSISLFNHVHNGVDFPQIDYNSLKNKPTGGSGVAFWLINQAGPGSGGTNYYSLIGVSSTEAGVQVACPVAGTISNLYVQTSTAQPGTGNYSLTLRKNAADTAVTLSVAAGGAAGVYSDTTHSVTVAAGDLLDLKGLNSATSNAATILYLSFKLS